MGTVVRLGDMFRNQLDFYFYVMKNMIPRNRGLDKRQRELLYILQNRIELKESGTLVCGPNFHYSIPKMVLVSILHAKDHNRADLAVFITKFIRSLDHRIYCLGIVR